MPALETDRLALPVKEHGDVARRWTMSERTTGEEVGEVCLLVCDEGFEIGWAVLEPYRGRGYAIEAARALLRHAFEDLGLEQVWAFVDEDNAASQRIAERLGMEHVRSEPGDDEVAPWREYAIAGPI